LETLCGLFRYASWIDIELDTGLGNLTWGSVPIGCQGVDEKRCFGSCESKALDVYYRKF